MTGWFFGKTAGLLGTMDHEKITDFFTPQGFIESDIGKFAYSWATDKEKCKTSENHAVLSTSSDEETINICTSLFKSKNSQFSTCFSRVCI